MQTMAFDSSTKNAIADSSDKYNNMFVKCVVGFLFLGVLYRFYFFTPFPPVLDSDTDFLRDSTWFPVPPDTSHLPGIYSPGKYFCVCLHDVPFFYFLRANLQQEFKKFGLYQDLN